ncbi:MAG: nonstructural protein [Microvirus sp.]|nr:MAG: nonstructural protein [Microvirus sp.]
MLHICSVFDNKAKVFGRPFFVTHVAHAYRSLSDEVNRTGAGASEIANHPEDFELYVMGKFLEEDGTFDTERPMLLVGCSQLVRYVE